jgi:hypothetical protein
MTRLPSTGRVGATVLAWDHLPRQLTTPSSEDGRMDKKAKTPKKPKQPKKDKAK